MTIKIIFIAIVAFLYYITTTEKFKFYKKYLTDKKKDIVRPEAKAFVEECLENKRQQNKRQRKEVKRDALLARLKAERGEDEFYKMMVVTISDWDERELDYCIEKLNIGQYEIDKGSEDLVIDDIVDKLNHIAGASALKPILNKI